MDKTMQQLKVASPYSGVLTREQFLFYETRTTAKLLDEGLKVDELANTLQACADCGAKKVLLPAVSMIDFATVPADLMTAFQLIPYQNAEDAVFKALGVE